MRFLAFLLLAGTAASAQTGTDSFFIHKFQQRIGTERVTVGDARAGTRYDVTYEYVDRGSPVSLRASLTVQRGFERYRIQGGTSRFSSVNDSIELLGPDVLVTVNNVTTRRPLPANAFPVSGYAPATTQEQLLAFWKRVGRPATLPLLPSGTARIRLDGCDTLRAGGQALVLERYVITGIIWGNELLWTDTRGHLVCLITNDAEGDKQEIMAARYEALLPQLIGKAARTGMQLFAAAQGGSGKERSGAVAILHPRLVDVLGGHHVDDALIVTKGGRITYAGPFNEKAIPAGAVRIDGRGRTALPGLWDMHAHFQQAEWGPAYLAAGITSVRDCGNEFDYINAVKDAIDRGVGPGPHILKAGIIDGQGPYALGIVQAGNTAEAVAAVQRYKAAGYAQIKIYSSATPAVVKAICTEAHRVGLSVTGHVPEGMNLKQAIDSGFNMVNHIPYVRAVLKKDSSRQVDYNDSSNIAFLRRLADTRFVVDPTLSVFELAFRDLRDSITAIEPGFATMPAPLKPLFRNTGDSDSTNLARGRFAMQEFKHLTKALVDAGVPVVAGSDMGFPGNSLLRELELYVDAGLTPLQALQTATIVPARVMGVAGNTGSLSLDKSADLVLVAGDPLTDIHAVRRPVLVLKDGRGYQPEDLQRLAGFDLPARVGVK